MSKKKLKIGVFLDTVQVERWVARALREIHESRFAELSVLVVNGDSPPGRVSGAGSGDSPSSLLYRLYRRLDYRLFGLPHDAMASEDVSGLFSDAVLRVLPFRESGEVRLRDEDREAIASHDLDVALRFGFDEGGVPADCARHGVWSHRFGEYGGPPLFREIHEGDPLSGSSLRIRTPGLGEERVIYRSVAATDPRSLYRSRNPVLWKSSAFIPRMLEDLNLRGWDAFRDRHLAQGPSGEKARSHPSNLQMVRFLARLSRTLARFLFHKTFRRDQWLIAHRAVSRSDLMGETGLGFPEFRTLDPPRDRLQADPFVAERGGRRIVFYEDLRFRVGKGVISWVEIDRAGNPGATGLALERPYHLSYPFLFEWNGELYMMPETAYNRTVEVYRCRSFPGHWELETTLFEDIEAADATIHEHDGTFWLFMNVNECGGSICDELFLYSASSPLGPWTPHPGNPVVSDVSRSRPAGALFVRDGQLIRPSQDSSRGYGSALNLNRVDVLTATDYRETLVERIEPPPGFQGVHTLNEADGLAVVDVRRVVRK